MSFHPRNGTARAGAAGPGVSAVAVSLLFLTSGMILLLEGASEDDGGPFAPPDEPLAAAGPGGPEDGAGAGASGRAEGGGEDGSVRYWNVSEGWEFDNGAYDGAVGVHDQGGMVTMPGYVSLGSGLGLGGGVREMDLDNNWGLVWTASATDGGTIAGILPWNDQVNLYYHDFNWFGVRGVSALTMGPGINSWDSYLWFALQPSSTTNDPVIGALCIDNGTFMGYFYAGAGHNLITTLEWDGDDMIYGAFDDTSMFRFQVTNMFLPSVESLNAGFPLYPDPGGSDPYKITDLCASDDNYIWGAVSRSSGSGSVFYINPSGAIPTHFDLGALPDGGNPTCLSDQSGSSIWVGTVGPGGKAGSARLDVTNRKVNTGLDVQCSESGVRGITVDRLYRIWMTVRDTGANTMARILYFDPPLYECRDYTGVSEYGMGKAFVAGHDGTIWGGTEDGSVFRMGEQPFTAMKIANTISQRNVIDLMTTVDHGIVYGSASDTGGADSVLFEVNVTRGTLKQVNGGSPPLTGEKISALTSDGRGTLWAATKTGKMFSLDAATGNINDVNGGSTITGGRAITALTYFKGELFGGTASPAEVFSYDPEQDQFRFIEDPSGHLAGQTMVTDLTIDRNGDLWGSTAPGGVLFIMSTGTHKFLWSDTPMGSGNEVTDLVTSEGGDVWGAAKDTFWGFNAVFKMDVDGRNLAWWTALPNGTGAVGDMAATWDGSVWLGMEDDGIVMKLDGQAVSHQITISLLERVDGISGDTGIHALCPDGYGGFVGGGWRGGSDAGTFHVIPYAQYTSEAYQFGGDVEWQELDWGEHNDYGTGLAFLIRSAPPEDTVWTARYEQMRNTSGHLDLFNPNNSTLQYTAIFLTGAASHTPRLLWTNVTLDGTADWYPETKPDQDTLAPDQRCNLTIILDNRGWGPGGQLLVNLTLPEGLTMQDSSVEESQEAVQFTVPMNESQPNSTSSEDPKFTSHFFLFTEWAELRPEQHMMFIGIAPGSGLEDGLILTANVTLEWTSRDGKLPVESRWTNRDLHVSRPDVELTMDIYETTVESGGAFGGELTVYNNGSGVARELTVTIPLPKGLSYDQGDGTTRAYNIFVDDERMLRAQFDPVNGYEEWKVPLNFNVDRATDDGAELKVRADLSYLDNGGNAYETSAGPHYLTVLAPAVELMDVELDLNCTPGAEAELVIPVVNTGSGTAGGVWVDTVLPDGFEIVRSSTDHDGTGYYLEALEGAWEDNGGNGTNRTGAGGQVGARGYVPSDSPSEKALTLTVRLNRDDGDGTEYEFPVIIKYADSGMNMYPQVNATPLDMVNRKADLSLSVRPADQQAEVGQPVELAFTLENTGSVPAADVGVSMELPEGLVYANSSRDELYGDNWWGWGEGFQPGEETVNVTLDLNGPRSDRMEVTFRLTYRQPGSQSDYGQVERTGTAVVNLDQSALQVEIESTSPQMDAAAVPTDTNVTITFNTPMEQSSVEGSFSMDPFTSHQLSWDDERTLRVAFDQPLDEGTRYAFSIGTTARSLAGIELGGDFVLYFTTAGAGPDNIDGDGEDGGDGGDGVDDGDDGETGVFGTGVEGGMCILLLLIILVVIISVIIAVLKSRKDKRLAEEERAAKEAGKRPPRGMVQAEVEYQPVGGVSRESDLDRISAAGAAGAGAGAGAAAAGAGGEGEPAALEEAPDLSGAIEAGLAANAALAGADIPTEDGALLGDGAARLEGADGAAVPPDVAAAQAHDGELEELDDIFSFGAGAEGPQVLALPPARSLDDGEPGAVAPDGAPLPVDEDRSSIDKIFLLSPDNILMTHYTRKTASDMDPDILSSMLMAVQAFVKDSLQTQDGALDELKFGKMTIIIRRGEYITIAAMVSGPDPKEFRPQVQAAVEDIETMHRGLIEGWDGDMESTRPLDDNMKRLVLGEYKAAAAAEVEAEGEAGAGDDTDEG